MERIRIGYTIYFEISLFKIGYEVNTEYYFISVTIHKTKHKTKHNLLLILLIHVLGQIISMVIYETIKSRIRKVTLFFKMS